MSGPDDSLAQFSLTGASTLPQDTLDSLLPAVYGELRALAAAHLRAERADHTLQPTALVHEAYLRLAAVPNLSVVNRSQFFALAAQMMRRILVNHAEARNAAKRGGAATRVTLDDSVSWEGGRDVDLLALDEALSALAAVSPRQAQVVELRFFAGLGIDEAAAVLEISPATLKRDWTLARAWLREALAAD